MTDQNTIGCAMIVDDEPFDQMMYERILKRSGLVDQVIGFQYAAEALDYLARPDRSKVDVIFLDINMPRMNGFEFLEAANRDLGPAFVKVCVVMLTTSIAPEDRARAASYDAVRDFISKPLGKDDVVHVANLLAEVE
ncbi:response regulator [Sulfitobacter mediterraneus]|jgi:CheY-like chemotaxis protein|uniref:response regulator n=1 Tax=Sulfitobacter mediterraneus TaxID=83219 RepID=UPI0021A27E20|nr:response regulator [Sulfitobacter mediterraneus]